MIMNLIPNILYAVCYTLGGRDKAPLVRPRIWRRFLAPVAMSFGLIAVKGFHVSYVISFGAYVGAMYLTKYGGNKLWEKVINRMWSGFIVGIASLPIALFSKSYVLLSLQIALAVLAHLSLGIKNPFPEKYKAELEEFTISFLTVALVPFMG